MKAIDASEMNKLFSMMPKHLLDEQANCLLNKNAGILKHKIGIIHIYELNGIFISVNSQSLAMIYFNTESEAVDFYLDRIEGIKEYNQTQMKI